MKVIDGAERPVAKGLLDPERAYLAGKLVTDDREAVRRFQTVFPVSLPVTLEVGMKARPRIEELHAKGKLTNEVLADVVFLDLVPKLFRKEQAKGWNATLAFEIPDAAPYGVAVTGEQVTVTKGLPEKPTATVKMDMETLQGILNFQAMATAGNLGRIEIDDSEFLDAALSDDQLEAVSGGKGCGAEAGGGQGCGADACGAAFGAGTGTGAGACGAAWGSGTVCGADACGGAIGGVSGCAVAACAVAACGADVCGAAVGASGCVAAACGAAAGVGACGGAACGADAGVGGCVGNACGAALGAGVCAGNACGVDVLAGADAGPCGVNVIPCFPGI